jgi:hypothetical protein
MLVAVEAYDLTGGVVVRSEAIIARILASGGGEPLFELLELRRDLSPSGLDQEKSGQPHDEPELPHPHTPIKHHIERIQRSPGQ